MHLSLVCSFELLISREGPVGLYVCPSLSLVRFCLASDVDRGWLWGQAAHSWSLPRPSGSVTHIVLLDSVQDELPSLGHPKLREVKQFAQGHTANCLRAGITELDLNLGLQVPEVMCLSLAQALWKAPQPCDG